MNKHSAHLAIVGVAALLVGVAIGSSVSILGQSPDSSALSADVRDEVVSSRFTNPLLECTELPEAISIGDRKELQQKVESLISLSQQRGEIAEASVYFRDLNNGPWFGVNAEEKFYPASLLKIPLAMWYYWAADTEPTLLDEEIQFVGPPGVSLVHYKPQTVLQVGETYTVNELIRYMLVESDNDAAYILHEYLGTGKAEQVYRDLGVTFTPAGESPIDVRTFASFFRILYNATYLGRSLSEHMLQTMTQGSFTQGLVSGVPSSVSVSHKFGEKQLDAEGNLVQLHDCGVIYHPETPYLLCVMTQGKGYESSARFIQDVSKTVFEYVDE